MAKKRSRVYLLSAVLAVLFLLWFGTAGAYAETPEDNGETSAPKTQAVTVHTPRHFIYDYNDAAAGKRIREEGTNCYYADWNSLSILLPGDSVEIIPKVPSASSLTSQGQAVSGYCGVVFTNPESAGNRGPVRVTKTATYGGKDGGTEKTFIQGFEIIGTEPVIVACNSGGGYATDNQVSGPNGITGSLSYYVGNLAFKYYPNYIRIGYQYVDASDETVTFDADQVRYYRGEGKSDPDAIWAVDAIYNHESPDAAEKVSYDVFQPHLEGYAVEKVIINKSSQGYNKPDYTGWSDGVFRITPRWGDNSRSGLEYALVGSYEDDWVAIRYEMLGARTLTLDACGGTIDGYADRIYEMNKTEYLDALKEREESTGFIPKWDGHYFAGWYKDPDHKEPAGSIYETVSGYSNSGQAPLEERSCRLYAKWHEFETIAEKAPTTKAEGNIAYLKCRDCGGYFDKETYEEIKDKTSVIIPKLFSGWKTTSEGKRFYDPDTGNMVTGIKTIGSSKYYFGTDGVMKTGMQTIGSGKYYFGTDGVMKTGMQTIGSVKYYFGTDGVMKTGWVQDGKTWYFMDKKSGVMKTGWIQDGKWYFMDKKTGAMKTGWVQDGKKWYFMDKKSGAMKTGWVQDGKTWYFLKKDGSMAANEYCGGYWLDKSGKWTYKAKASWKKDKVGWYYIDTKGWYAKNTTLTIDGKKYAFDKRGYLK